MKTIKFDKALTRLEEIVENLEQNEEDLEKLLALFEEGTKLLKTCKKQLNQFENKLQILSEEDTLAESE
jgi:exodeoxyribonuclease VII small subunit